ncbi:MAG: metallophosphoesterase [Treponema sp.]|nr:metallophosphoesterase [Treponema sp.]
MLNKIPHEKKEILEIIKELSDLKTIAESEDLLFVSREAVRVLKNEITDYRKTVSEIDEIPGGLIDFTHKCDADVVVVPDLHARKGLIYALLTHILPDGKSVFDCLCDNSISVIFLGDILHSESQKKDRWCSSYEKYLKGDVLNEEMTEEMIDGLSTLMQVMLLKSSFPEKVHCLKGNHENIKNENSSGNFAFRKFVDEGNMVHDFMMEKYGEEVVEEIYKFELLLPVAAVFDNLIISHAEPLKPYSREEIIDSVLTGSTVFGLTWTSNDEAENDSAEKMFKILCVDNGIEKKYITGHRPVKGKFNLRQDGNVVQIHNPKRMQIAFIKKGEGFDPDSDIYEL